LSESRALRVAVPWLQSELRSALDAGRAPRLPDLRWLAGRAEIPAAIQCTWREWLLGASGAERRLLDDWPAGPCLRVAEEGVRPAGHWAVAEPVHFLTALDHLRLAPLDAVSITDGEAAALADSLRAHLAGSPFSLETITPERWSLGCAQALQVASRDPAEAVGCNVRELLPEGPDGRAVRGLMNELQMALHEHPVNEARERSGRPAINALWLWGFGTAAPAREIRLPALATDDFWLRGLWRAHCAPVGPLTAAADLIAAAPGVACIAVTGKAESTARDVLESLDASLFRRLRQAVAKGGLGDCEILLGATVLRLGRGSRLRFWRRPRPLEALA
jgi:hypothetical protein